MTPSTPPPRRLTGERGAPRPPGLEEGAGHGLSAEQAHQVRDPSPIPPAPSRWEGERVALCRQGCRPRGASLASPAPLTGSLGRSRCATGRPSPSPSRPALRLDPHPFGARASPCAPHAASGRALDTLSTSKTPPDTHTGPWRGFLTGAGGLGYPGGFRGLGGLLCGQAGERPRPARHMNIEWIFFEYQLAALNGVIRCAPCALTQDASSAQSATTKKDAPAGRKPRR